MSITNISTRKFSDAEYNSYGSSPEILAAIEYVTGAELPAGEEDEDNKEGNVAHRVWTNPSDAEISRVEEVAWALADEGIETLKWGFETVRRPVSAA